MVMNSDLTNFQKFTFQTVITFEWNLVHFITLFMLTTFNSLHSDSAHYSSGRFENYSFFFFLLYMSNSSENLWKSMQ